MRVGYVDPSTAREKIVDISQIASSDRFDQSPVESILGKSRLPLLAGGSHDLEYFKRIAWNPVEQVDRNECNSYF